MEKPKLDLGGDYLEGMGSYWDAAELEACHLSLKLPEVAVDVKDAAAEKVSEYSREGLAFWVVVETGFDHVLDVFRVSCDGVVEYVDVDGFGWGLAEEMRVPVAEIVEFSDPARC